MSARAPMPSRKGRHIPSGPSTAESRAAKRESGELDSRSRSRWSSRTQVRTSASSARLSSARCR
eukprot:7691565-Lingulodinium_polyedra.AAC.1